MVLKLSSTCNMPSCQWRQVAFKHKKKSIYIIHAVEICLLASNAAKHSMGENNASAVRNKKALQFAISVKTANIQEEFLALIFSNCIRTSSRRVFIYYYYYYYCCCCCQQYYYYCFLCPFFSHPLVEELPTLLYQTRGRIDSLQQNCRHQRLKVQYDQ